MSFCPSTTGRHLPISILGLDITGEDVHETGLIWDSGDGDLRAWPIPGTLKSPARHPAAARQVLMSMSISTARR
jgi:glutamine synthetase